MLVAALLLCVVFASALFFIGLLCSSNTHFEKTLIFGLLLLACLSASMAWFESEVKYDSRGRPTACTVLEEYQLYTLVHQTTSDNKTFAWVQNAKTKEMRLVELPEPVPAGMEQFTVLYPPDKKIAFIPPLLPAPGEARPGGRPAPAK